MGFGSDFSGVDDLDPLLTFLEGDADEVTSLIQAVARRYITPRGGLFYDPSYGLDLRLFVASTYSPAQIEALAAAEARKEERVADCSATATLIGEALTLQIRCTSNTGATFDFTLNVSKVTVTLLTTGQL